MVVPGLIHMLSLIEMIFAGGPNRSQTRQNRFNKQNTMAIYAIIPGALCILLRLQRLFGVYADSIVKEKIVDDDKELSNTCARVSF